jgi:hypothetical protein
MVSWKDRRQDILPKVETKEAIRKPFYHLEDLIKLLHHPFCTECFRRTVQKEEKVSDMRKIKEPKTKERI